MSGKYNPFKPSGAVAPGMFCGRLPEMEAVAQCLLQTRHGNPQHFLVEGERGIGKSSLMLYEQLVASGRIPHINGAKFSFITIAITLGENETFPSLVKKITTRLASEVRKREKFKTFVSTAWGVLSRFEAGGLKYNKPDEKFDEGELFDSLQTDLVEVLNNLDDSDGLLLLLDEADKGAEQARLGQLCKLLTEELSRQQCERLCIGLAGITGTINALRASHESSPRLFRTLELKPLELHERKEVIQRGLKEAREKVGRSITITDEAADMIVNLSEGYPHFLQEFAFCAYEEDSNDEVDQIDVLDSLFGENGAFDQLGKRYFSSAYNAPASDDYRQVLKVMSSHMDEWIERPDIIAEAGLKAGIVDNALRALKQRNIIVQDEGRRGRYRLPTKSFATWVRMRAIAEERAAQQRAETAHSLNDA